MHQTLPHSFSSFFSLKGLGTRLVVIFFYFLSQIRRSLRLSVCAFYIRVEALYTLKHHSAESVTSDFFIADPKIDSRTDR